MRLDRNGILIREFYAVVRVLKNWEHYLIGKEFVLSTNNQSLEYFRSQKHLRSTMHARWSAFVDKFPFRLVHKFGQHNRVVDALSRRVALIKALSVEIVSFDSLKELYAEDDDFKDVWELCVGTQFCDDFFIHDGFLMKGGQLCLPFTSICEKVIVGHLGRDKTIEVVKERYY